MEVVRDVIKDKAGSTAELIAFVGGNRRQLKVFAWTKMFLRFD